MSAFVSFSSRCLWRISPACRLLATQKRPYLFRVLSSDGKTAANVVREPVEDRPNERRVRKRGRRDHKNAYPDLGERGKLQESQASVNLSELMDSLRARSEIEVVTSSSGETGLKNGDKMSVKMQRNEQFSPGVGENSEDHNDLEFSVTAFSELLNKPKSPDVLSGQEGVSDDQSVAQDEIEAASMDGFPPTDHRREEIEENESEEVKGSARFGQPPEFEADPELANRVKNILSELKVEASHKGLAKGIVGAVRNWGKSHPRHREDLLQEYMSQERESFDEGPAVRVDFKFGPKLSLFNVEKETPEEVGPHKPFLMEMDKGDKIDQLVLADARRNDFEDLMAISHRQWRFPVDNEVCKVDEADVGFEEHTFLQYLLDEFPDTGPVRRFMELVINGLEQNPHLSVKEKKDQVFWFKEYFSNFSVEDLNF